MFKVNDIMEGQKGDQGGGPKMAKIQYGVKPDIFKITGCRGNLNPLAVLLRHSPGHQTPQNISDCDVMNTSIWLA